MLPGDGLIIPIDYLVRLCLEGYVAIHGFVLATECTVRILTAIASFDRHVAALECQLAFKRITAVAAGAVTAFVAVDIVSLAAHAAGVAFAAVAAGSCHCAAVDGYGTIECGAAVATPAAFAAVASPITPGTSATPAAFAAVAADATAAAAIDF